MVVITQHQGPTRRRGSDGPISGVLRPEFFFLLEREVHFLINIVDDVIPEHDKTYCTI